jgi:hypothetical protein
MVRIIVVPMDEMWPYIALHGMLPRNQLPVKYRSLPPDVILIREDIVVDDPERAHRIVAHELRERAVFIQNPHITYKKAHREAGY